MFYSFDADPDEAKTSDELVASINEQNKKIAGLDESIAHAAVAIDFVNAELEPYDADIAAINKQIEELTNKKKLIGRQRATVYQERIKAENDERSAKYEKKGAVTYLNKLKGLLHKTSKENEKVLKMKEMGERLESAAQNFTWYEHIKKYQLDAAKQMAVLEKVINGDDMGLGKSLTALAAADLVGAKKLLIVSKIDIVQNFENEVKRWAPHRNYVWSAVGYKRDFIKRHMRNVLPLLNEFVVLINFETWWSDQEIIQLLINLQFDAVIFDEAHHAKESKKKTASGFRKIIRTVNKCKKCGHRDVRFDIDVWFQCQKCREHQTAEDARSIKYVWPMTGSPILNRPNEFWPLLNMIDPVTFADERVFLDTYCQRVMRINLNGKPAQKWTFRVGGSNQLLRAIGPQFIRRTKQDVGIELPPQTVTVHNVPFTPETHPDQYNAYQQLIEYVGMVFDKQDDGHVIAADGASLITRLRQVTSWPAGIKIHERNPITEEKELVWECDVHESAKLDAAFEEIVEMFEAGKRTVFFAKHTAVLDEMKRRLDEWKDGEKPIRSKVYSGATSLYDRDRIKRDFDATRYDPENYSWDIILCQNEAASQGLNFTAAQHMIIVERMWGPKLEEQQLARTNRIGQTNETTVSFFQLADTIDMAIEELLFAKGKDIGEFEDAAGAVQALLLKLFEKAKGSKLGG